MPAPASLDQPGRRYVVRSTAAYHVYGHRFGHLEIERAADGATAYFQGDDSSALRAELEACDDAPDWVADAVLSQYDDVMTRRT